MSIYINCKNCNKRTKVLDCRIRKGHGKFCSRNCFHKYQKKVPRSKDWCQNISDSVKKEKHYKWKGFWISHGYKYIYKPNHKTSNPRGYVLEHRLVIEKNIGRYLVPTERVHHINGVKTDNRLRNLKLLKNTSEHSKIHFPKGTAISKFNPRRPRNKKGQFI